MFHFEILNGVPAKPELSHPACRIALSSQNKPALRAQSGDGHWIDYFSLLAHSVL